MEDDDAKRWITVIVAAIILISLALGSGEDEPEDEAADVIIT